MTKKKENARTLRLEVRLTEEEKYLLTRLTTLGGMTLSKWVRGVVLAAAGRELKRQGL